MSGKDQNPPATDFEWELSEPVLEAPNPSQCVAEEFGFVLIPEDETQDAPGPAPTNPQEQPVTYLHFERKAPKKRPLPLVVCLGLFAAAGAAATHETAAPTNSYQPSVTAVDSICDEPHQGQWTLSSGLDVLSSAQEVGILVLNQDGLGVRTPLAFASRVPESCLENSAPRLVLGHTSNPGAVVELTGYDVAGNTIGVGEYRFSPDPHALEAFSALSSKSSLADPSKHGTWATVDSGRDSIGCRIVGASKVDTLCGIDLQSTGKIQID